MGNLRDTGAVSASSVRHLCEQHLKPYHHFFSVGSSILLLDRRQTDEERTCPNQSAFLEAAVLPLLL